LSLNKAQSAVRPSLAPGTQVRDTYTVVEHLGSGRFADAYLVRHRYMGMQVMKLLVDGLSDADRVESLSEAFLLSKISHPGIVRVFDANRIDEQLGGHPYITMEYVAGGTLESMLKNSPEGLILDVALELGRQIAEALGHAHDLEYPVIHRDIKPANLLLEEIDNGELAVRIGDFGLACRVERFTKVAEAGGTIVYMSPESIRGYEVAASDVFSAGLVLYEMLTGTLPYPRRTISESRTVPELKLALQSLHENGLMAPSHFDPQIPADVDSVVMRSLHVDDQFRFQSATSLAHAIAACQHRLRSYPQHVQTADENVKLKHIFSATCQPETTEQAIGELDSLISGRQELAFAYGLHFKHLRIEWNRYLREKV